MSKIRRLVFILPVVIATLTLIGPGEGVAAARLRNGPGQQPAGNPKTLEGTWRVEVTLRNCLTGDPVQPAFPALASFTRDGTVTTSDGSVSPAARGTGLGVWGRVRGGAFAAVIEAFLFNGGVRTGLQRITQEIEVVAGGDDFNADVTSEIVDINGNVVALGCATSIGRRF